MLRGNVSGQHGVIHLHVLSRGHVFSSCRGHCGRVLKLCDGHVLCCGLWFLHGLLGWNLSGQRGCVELLVMQRRHISCVGRDHGLGKLLELRRGNVFVDGIVRLHELRGGDIPGKHGVVELLELFGGYLSGQHRGNISVYLLELCGWHVLGVLGWRLHVVLGGHVPNQHWRI
jgi:hypothetical protein